MQLPKPDFCRCASIALQFHSLNTSWQQHFSLPLDPENAREEEVAGTTLESDVYDVDMYCSYISREVHVRLLHSYCGYLLQKQKATVALRHFAPVNDPPGSTFADSSLVVGLLVVKLIVGAVFTFPGSCNHSPRLTSITWLSPCCIPWGCTRKERTVANWSHHFEGGGGGL